MNQPELLAPAGNWDCAKAAVAAGANAIFFGLPAFNARLRADNFTNEDLEPLMAFLHANGVKGYVTMNTLIFTKELPLAIKQLQLVQAAGVDALIVQDLGLASLISQYAPDVALHASTQMTITSKEGLSFLKSFLPITQAVLARELSLSEIKRMAGNAETPLEVFVHGALCVAYSGQCLTSESLGQRSANRGECAQACRMPYELVVDGKTKEMGDQRYLLSPQDLAAIDLVPSLTEAGVRSFKIEGRLKSPEYVFAVTRVYRQAIDKLAQDHTKSAISPEDRYALEMTFSRGLTTGWLAGTNHPYLTHGRFGKKRGPLIGTITTVDSPTISFETSPNAPALKAGDGIVFDAGEDRNHEQGARIWKADKNTLTFNRQKSGLDWSRIRPGQTLYKTSDPELERSLRKGWQTFRGRTATIPISITVSGKIGEPLQAKTKGLIVSSNQPLEKAQKQELSTELLAQQLGRLGGTSYSLGPLKNELPSGCYLPISALNQLRRELVALLDKQQNPAPPQAPLPSEPFILPTGSSQSSPETNPNLHVLCRSLEQLKAALEFGISEIYCDFEDPRRYRDALEAGKDFPESRIILATPRIIKGQEVGYLKQIAKLAPQGVLIRNLAGLEFFKDSRNLIKVGDFSLNAANPLTVALLLENGDLTRTTISYDLNSNQVLDLLHATNPEELELTLHQHMPLFHMEHCVFCTFMSEGTSYKDCGRPCESHHVELQDRVGQRHHLLADVGCRNTLFNGRAQTGARFFPDLMKAGLRQYRLELLREDELSTRALLQEYDELLSGAQTPAHLLDHLPALSRLGVTEGTLSEA